MKKIFTLIALAGIAGCSSDMCNSTGTAEVMAKKFVKRDLREPDSAVFSNVETKRDDKCEFTVYGVVSARNGFGGMRTSIFIKHLRVDPQTNRWSVKK